MQPEQWLAMGWTMSVYLLWLLVTDRMLPEQWLAMGWTMSVYLLWLLVTDRMQPEQWLAMGWTMSVYLLWLLVTDRLQPEQWLAMGWTMWDSNPGGGKIFPYPTRLAPRHTQPTVQWVPGLFPRGEVAGMWHWPHHPLLMLRMSAGRVICVTSPFCLFGMLQNNFLPFLLLSKALDFIKVDLPCCSWSD
jgi:hypothetical protein